jgi:hypothetical protein
MSIAGILGQIPWGQVASSAIQAFGQRPGFPMQRPPIPVGQAFTGGGAPGLPSFLTGGMARGRRIGRLTGQPIPPGTREKVSRTGQVILTEVRRARGLTGGDLKGFRRTIRLIRSVGMTPKGLKGRGGFKARRK